MHRRRPLPPTSQRGSTLAELMIALVVLSIGLLAVAQLFPAGSRSQVQDRMLTGGNFYAQEKLEQLVNVPWSDPPLTVGRHPSAGFDSLGDKKQWTRSYDVAVLAAPLDNLKKVTVTVNWKAMGSRTVTATTYVRR